MPKQWDHRTSLDIELETTGNCLGWIFGTFLIVVAVGLIIGAWVWL